METSQQSNSLQQTGSNLQPNRSDLQPISPANDQLSQGGVDQQKLPINNTENLRVETAQTGTALPAGISQGAPNSDSSLMPFFLVLSIIGVVLIGLVVAAVRSAKLKPAAVPVVNPEAPTVQESKTSAASVPAGAKSKKSTKKAPSKAKLKKKKTKKR